MPGMPSGPKIWEKLMGRQISCRVLILPTLCIYAIAQGALSDFDLAWVATRENIVVPPGLLALIPAGRSPRGKARSTSLLEVEHEQLSAYTAPSKCAELEVAVAIIVHRMAISPSG